MPHPHWVRQLWRTALCCRHRSTFTSYNSQRHLSYPATSPQSESVISSSPDSLSSVSRSLSFRGRSPFIVLGVETTCDDTAIAVVSSSGDVLSSVCASQWSLLQQYSGVHPGMAAREHSRQLPVLYQHALEMSGRRPAELDIIAVAAGPGLAPCLAAGVAFASSVARSLSRPLFAVHHLLSHAAAASLSHPSLSFPHLSLLVSGGHTELWLQRSPTDVLVLGETRDDAMGEAVDKAARLLAVDRRPEEAGGAALERAAAQACTFPLPQTVAALPPLPLPLAAQRGCDFSFAGLKTALASRIDAIIRSRQGAAAAASSFSSSSSFSSQPLTAAEQSHLAFAFQSVCCSHVAQRTLHALSLARRLLLADGVSLRHLVLAGGVACNQSLQAEMRQRLAPHGLELCVPEPQLCSDNGVMIGWMAAQQAAMGCQEDALDVAYQPHWPAGTRLDLSSSSSADNREMSSQHSRQRRSVG